MKIDGKKVLIGVTGGIAAYKALDVIRRLTREGADCQVVMTSSATRLVCPESFEAITGRRVAVDMWESDRDFRSAEAFGPSVKPIHIDLAQKADLFLITPATANTIARMAAGIADNLLTAAYLAADCPVVAAPAMNSLMWEHGATRRNVDRIAGDGVRIIPPGTGELACGYSGPGRVAEPADQVAVVLEMLTADSGSGDKGGGDLKGRRVVVTAGRTEEPIDPVRVLTNRSSGRMGVAIAAEAKRRGADVTLVAGALSVHKPRGVEVVDARTVSEMAASVREAARNCDVLIMAAAVGDFRPKAVFESKQKRKGATTIELEPTEDILQSIGESRGSIDVLVGFALETDDLEENGKKKLEKKKLDLIVINRPDIPGGGIDKECTEVIVLGRDGDRIEIPLTSKSEIAVKLLDRVVSCL